MNQYLNHYTIFHAKKQRVRLIFLERDNSIQYARNRAVSSDRKALQGEINNVKICKIYFYFSAVSFWGVVYAKFLEAGVDVRIKVVAAF